MHVSKNQLKRVRGLTQKKNRQEEQAFLVEGEHALLELLASDWPIELCVVTDLFAQQHAQALGKIAQLFLASPEDLAKSGSLQSNNAGLAIVPMPQTPARVMPSDDWVLALDRLNDPGNFGTLLRIADWYGIRQIITSPDSVELFNPKVISASKGAFLRVQVQSADLSDYLARVQAAGHPVYGAYLEGENTHQLAGGLAKGVLLMGNEAQGISPSLADYVSRKLTIPAFGGAESLNVGVAAGILMDSLKRLEA
jgi:TrmH family RNA methyltransferase